MTTSTTTAWEAVSERVGVLMRAVPRVRPTVVFGLGERKELTIKRLKEAACMKEWGIDYGSIAHINTDELMIQSNNVDEMVLKWRRTTWGPAVRVWTEALEKWDPAEDVPEELRSAALRMRDALKDGVELEQTMLPWMRTLATTAVTAAVDHGRHVMFACTASSFLACMNPQLIGMMLRRGVRVVIFSVHPRAHALARELLHLDASHVHTYEAEQAQQVLPPGLNALHRATLASKVQMPGRRTHGSAMLVPKSMAQPKLRVPENVWGAMHVPEGQLWFCSSSKTHEKESDKGATKPHIEGLQTWSLSSVSRVPPASAPSSSKKSPLSADKDADAEVPPMWPRVLSFVSLASDAQTWACIMHRAPRTSWRAWMTYLKEASKSVRPSRNVQRSVRHIRKRVIADD
jgi:hypothetical protein